LNKETDGRLAVLVYIPAASYPLDFQKFSGKSDSLYWRCFLHSLHIQYMKDSESSMSKLHRNWKQRRAEDLLFWVSRKDYVFIEVVTLL